MSRRVLLALVALAAALALGTAACATSGDESAASPTVVSSTSAPGTSSNEALCRAADDVRTSLTGLQQVDAVQQGTETLQQAWAQVKSDLADLSDAARAQYADQVQRVKTDTDALEAALGQARTNPSTQTVGAATTAARTLAQDTQALLAAVGSAC